MRVGLQYRRTHRVRHGHLPVLPGAVDVVHAPDVALGEVLVLAGNLVQAFTAQGHVRQRLAQLAVQRQAPFDAVQAVDNAVPVIDDAQGLVQVESVRAGLPNRLHQALHQQFAPHPAGRVDIGELDGGLRRPLPPLRLPGERVTQLPLLHAPVGRVLRVAAEIVDMQHHAEAEPVGFRHERRQGRSWLIVGVVAVVAVRPPPGDVKQGLRGVAMRREVPQQRWLGRDDHYEPHLACPGWPFLRERHEPKPRLRPLPVNGRARLPVSFIRAEAPPAGDDARLVLKRRGVSGLEPQPERVLEMVEHQRLEPVVLVVRPDYHSAAPALEQHERRLPAHGVIKLAPLRRRVRAKPLAAAPRHQHLDRVRHRGNAPRHPH